MGVSLVTALVISTNEVEAISAGPNSEGKYQGMIAHSKTHLHHPLLPILTSMFMFNSAEEAEAEMRNQIQSIRKVVEERIPPKGVGNESGSTEDGRSPAGSDSSG